MSETGEKVCGTCGGSGVLGGAPDFPGDDYASTMSACPDCRSPGRVAKRKVHSAPKRGSVSRATAKKAVRKAVRKATEHGRTCEKVSHGAGGYLHAPDYDGPYEVDGVRYCGRCHVALPARSPEGEVAMSLSEGEVERCPVCGDPLQAITRGGRPQVCPDHGWPDVARGPEAERPEEAREHELKSWPEFFSEVVAGRKRFDLRKDDRGFRAGDTLHLREWLPHEKRYTGREARFTVEYVTSGLPWLQPGYVCMSIEPARSPEGEVRGGFARTLQDELERAYLAGRDDGRHGDESDVPAFSGAVSRLTSEAARLSSDSERGRVVPPSRPESPRDDWTFSKSVSSARSPEGEVLEGLTPERLRELADEWTAAIDRDPSLWNEHLGSAIRVCRGAAAQWREAERERVLYERMLKKLRAP